MPTPMPHMPPQPPAHHLGPGGPMPGGPGMGMPPDGREHMQVPMPPGPHGPHLGPQHGPPHHHLQPPRFHSHFMGQLDFRLFEFNKRLQQRREECDNLWWDGFASEFFEDDATLTLTFTLDDGTKRYTIGRTMIPRYFRSIFESGVTELYYVLRGSRESFHNTSVTVDCEHAQMITQHTKPMLTKVVTEGRLLLDFTFDDMMRIRTWHFQIRQHRELIARSVLSMPQEPGLMEQMSKNITRSGLTHNTLNFLRLCVILEPMQELMSRQKAFNLGPRECLKTTLFQKWQRMVAPPGQPGKTETGRQTNKRRKRKPSTANDSGGVRGSKRKNQSPGPQLSALGPPGDVMIVGEPTLMGGDFGEEDERLITRLENSQFGSAGGPPGDAASQQMRPPPPPRSSSRGGKPNSVPAGVPPSSNSGPMGPVPTSGPPGPPGGLLADRRPNSAGCPPGGADNPPPAAAGLTGPPSCGVKQEQNSPSGKSTPGRSTTPANTTAPESISPSSNAVKNEPEVKEESKNDGSTTVHDQ